MEPVHNVPGRVVPKPPLQSRNVMRRGSPEHHCLRNFDRRARRPYTRATRPEDALDVRLLAHGGVGIQVHEPHASRHRVRDGRLPRRPRIQPPVRADDELPA